MEEACLAIKAKKKSNQMPYKKGLLCVIIPLFLHVSGWVKQGEN
jgi:hypothetical protein